MSYNNGSNFGYDQISVVPELDPYSGNEYALDKNQRKREEDLIKKLKLMENSENMHVKEAPRKIDTKLYDDEMKIQKTLYDLRKKNDTFVIVIIFLVVFVIMQHNTINMLQQHMAYTGLINSSNSARPTKDL